ncbi:MAG: glycosyltransferase [Acidobacteriota bacterium]|nr:glycosyltransferase [Acidobacteriota bacterium]
MQSRLLSILMPVYNEEEFITAILDRVLSAPLPEVSGVAMQRELIVVDDASTDGTLENIEEYITRHPDQPIRLISHDRNRGKGAAVRTALAHASGEYSIIQDADLEYDPREYPNVLRPLLDGRADVVYGSRFLAAGERRVLYFWHALANHLLTTMCNIVADLNLTDMETCYKAFRTTLAQSIPLRSERFGIEPELTIKFAKREARIYEVPIGYSGRTYDEGKKIGIKDAFAAFGVILRYALSADVYNEHGPDILDTLSRAKHFNRWMADTVSPYLGNEVLELGAGIGNLTRLVASRRRRYIATDIDTEHLSRLVARLHHRPNIETAICDLSRTADFEPWLGKVDSVICLNVLEHIEDDMAGLRNIRGCLKPGGRAVILVPQGSAVYGTLDEVLGHFRRYSKAELENKMKSTGYRVEQVLEFNRITYPGWYVNGKLLRRRHFSRFQLGVFDRLVWMWRRIDPLIPWPSTSIIGVGVRDS